MISYRFFNSSSIISIINVCWTVSKANEVKQVNNIQNQTLQNRSVQPKAAGAIEGDYLLDSNNAIPLRDENGNSYNFWPFALNSDGVGIGPRGYLFGNYIDKKIVYVGYDGKIIWSFQNSDFEILNIISILYDETNQTFAVLFSCNHNGAKGLALSFLNEEDGHEYHTAVNLQALSSDLSNSDYRYTFMVPIRNMNNGELGLYIISRLGKTFNQMKIVNVFFKKTNSPLSLGSRGTLNSEVVASGDDFYFSQTSLNPLPNDGGDGSILSAGATNIDGKIYLLLSHGYFTTRFTNTIRFSTLIDNTFKIQYNDENLTLGSNWFNNIASREKFSSEIAIYPLRDGFNFSYFINDTRGDVNGILSGNLLRRDNTFNNFEYREINYLSFNNKDYFDYDVEAIKFYKGTYYIMGTWWPKSLESSKRYNRVTLINGMLSRPLYTQSSNFNYREGTINTNLTQGFDAPITTKTYDFKNIMIFPSYTNESNSFKNSNINLISLDSSQDGKFAYNTNLTGSEIDISSNETLKNLTALKTTGDQIKEEIIKDDFKLLRQGLTRFNSASEITVAPSSDWTSAEQQNLYAQGKLSINLTVSKAYGNTNGDLSTTTFQKHMVILMVIYQQQHQRKLMVQL